MARLNVVDSFFRALRLHPDKGGDPELFKEVTHAYVLHYMYRFSLSHFVDTRFFPTHKSVVYMMLEAKLVFPSKAEWVGWIPRYGLGRHRWWR